MTIRNRKDDSAIARRRGKQIYLELSVALRGTKFPVTLASVRDTLAREGLPAYTVRALEKWRRADTWDAFVASGATALPVPYIDQANVTLEDLEGGGAQGLDLFVQTASALAKRLSNLAEDETDETTVPKIVECLPVLTRVMNETLALRRQILDDRAREAIDIKATRTLPALEGPAQSPFASTLDKMRAKLDNL
ncbi:hypothetical protein QEV83_03795 [Methylocapsa sp. D3K7]|uniref:hypothetical protein n=1 Tax=Methylocapsa sp. D3K7 TaxID=3041435 RepID=UPI00244E7E53|nr:hypothetical protein [Methylocapsa sp. D3K7]WGJ15415.1 hypothetical protein QEV83_03795 [Methylocapsa sp. D3K7]